MKFEKWVPVGISAARERWWLLSGIGIPLLMGVGFLLRYSNACQYLYRMVNGRRELIDGAKIPDFIELLRPMPALSLTGGALVMLGLLMYHWLYHYQGSRSIYLMRRLPRRFELTRRCLTVPLVEALVCLAVTLVLVLLFYWLYHSVTPDVCLRPRQWQKLWMEGWL